MNKMLNSAKTKLTTVVLLLVVLLFACNGADRKTELERRIDVIYVDSSQRTIEADVLAALFTKDRKIFAQTFHDSTLFVIGNIARIDDEHGEIIMRNSHEADIVCLLKDSAAMQYLSRNDYVLLKGICRNSPGTGVVLIGQCEVAQIKP